MKTRLSARDNRLRQRMHLNLDGLQVSGHILHKCCHLCSLLTDRTKEGPSTLTHVAIHRPLLWCRPEQSMYRTPRIMCTNIPFANQSILFNLSASSHLSFTATPQLHWGKNSTEAASWDGLQWEGRERRALPVPRHWWQGGRLHCPCGPSTQRRGKGAFATQKTHVKVHCIALISCKYPEIIECDIRKRRPTFPSFFL